MNNEEGLENKCPTRRVISQDQAEEDLDELSNVKGIFFQFPTRSVRERAVRVLLF